MPADQVLNNLEAHIKELEAQLAEAVRILHERPSSADQIMSKKRRVLWGVQVKAFLKNYRRTHG